MNPILSKKIVEQILKNARNNEFGIKEYPPQPRKVDAYFIPPGTLGLKATNRPRRASSSHKGTISLPMKVDPDCCCQTCISPLELAESCCPSCKCLLFRCPKCDGLRRCQLCKHKPIKVLHCPYKHQQIKEANARNIRDKLKKNAQTLQVQDIQVKRALLVKDRFIKRLKKAEAQKKKTKKKLSKMIKKARKRNSEEIETMSMERTLLSKKIKKMSRKIKRRSRKIEKLSRKIKRQTKAIKIMEGKTYSRRRETHSRKRKTHSRKRKTHIFSFNPRKDTSEKREFQKRDKI